MSTDHVAKEEDVKGETPSPSPSPSALSSPKFRTTHKEGVTVLEVRGDLEDEHTAAFRDALFQTIKGVDSGSDPGAAMGTMSNAGDIAVDLSDVTFLSEESLAVLIHAPKLQRAQGAAVRPSPFVQRKMRRTTLSPFFPIDED